MDTTNQTRTTNTQPQTQDEDEDRTTPISDSFFPAEKKKKKKKQTYAEWVREIYQAQYEKWMPWLEEQYLKWFGKGDNKASYVVKENLSKTKLTGDSGNQVDQLQDDVNNLVGNQLGERGLLAPVGNVVSKEGINRVERKGKGEDGSYGGSLSSGSGLLGGITGPVVEGTRRPLGGK